MSELGILPNPIPFGKYYLLERVNIGGMAEIFKAKAFGVEGFERLLAVKKILASIAEDESFINMFIDEAKIAGQLNHPNIAQIFDLGRVSDDYFIALEYISGKDFKTIFERSRRIGEKVSIPRVCHIMMKVCEGLGYAHAKKDAQGQDLNIVHRDVSPQNILLSYEGEVKIIDFGIAKAQGKTSQTQVGILKGKFSYMSPEQVRGLHIDRRSDIFSLGIVLYELLTLERLFLGESDFDTLEKIRKVEMSPPSLYNPHIPKELEDVVLKALAKSPEDRYQTSHELADALEQFMRNQGYYYTNKDLAAYMKEAFSADIEFENKKLEYYRSLNLQPPEESSAPSRPKLPKPGLSWDDDEHETQVFDRDDELIEELDVADIVYSERVEAVRGTGSTDSGPRASADDPPTVEFDRDQMAAAFDRLSFEDDAPDSRFSTSGDPRRRSPTAQMPSIEPRRSPHITVTSPGAPIPSGVPAPRRSGSSAATVMGVGAIVVIISFGLIYLLWPWPAEIEFSTDPARVQILVDNAVVYDGQTPYTYKIKPGLHDVVIKADGFKPYTLKQEFQKSTPYKFDQKLEPLQTNPPLELKTTPPDALVVIGTERFEGASPKKIDSLAPGDYEAKVSAPGYAAATEKFTLKEDEPASLDVTLEPLKIKIAISSEPSKSDYVLLADGAKVHEGETPAIHEDLDGSKTYKLVVKRDGYEDHEQTYPPGEALSTALSAKLTKAAVAANDPPKKDPTPKSTTRKDPPRKDPPRKDPVKVVKKDPPKKDPPKKDPPKKDPPKVAGKGTIKISSRPRALVYINGKSTGKYTPVKGLELSAGKDHKIELVNEDFGLRKTYYIKLKPGESRFIKNLPK
jgi:serine/threonine protein kinase